MSFGAHIEELRVVLLRSMIGIGIGFAVGLWLGPKVVVFLQEPLNVAIQDFQKEQAKTKIREAVGFLDPKLSAAIETEQMIPRKFKVEKTELAQAINAATRGEIHLEESRMVGFEEAQLSPAQTIQLCEQFRDRRTKQQEFLWNKLDSRQQQSIKEIAAEDEASVADTKKAIRILNSLLSDESIYQSDVFDDTILASDDLNRHEEVIVAAKQNGDLNSNEVRSLNQHLVAAAFPESINKPKMVMVPIVLWDTISSEAQSLGIQEPFMVWLKAGFFTGMAISSPWVFLQIWSFVAGGLYPHEKNYVYLYMPFSLILFVGGAAFAFYIVFKYVLDFLFTFNAQMGIEPDPRIGEYLGFVLMLPIGFGFAFQLPLVMLFLHRIGLTSIKMYLSKWRIAILIVCVISMIFTPTDPISMILMALPLSGLYFFGILLCVWLPRGRNPFGEGYDPA